MNIILKSRKEPSRDKDDYIIPYILFIYIRTTRGRPVIRLGFGTFVLRGYESGMYWTNRIT